MAACLDARCIFKCWQLGAPCASVVVLAPSACRADGSAEGAHSKLQAMRSFGGILGTRRESGIGLCALLAAETLFETIALTIGFDKVAAMIESIEHSCR